MHAKGNEVDLERDKSVISGSTDLEHLHTFHDFPVFMGSTQQSLADDIFAPQSWSICRDSGVIQLDQLLPLDVLYPESHGAGQVGSLWQHHHADFAAFVNGAKPSAHGLFWTRSGKARHHEPSMRRDLRARTDARHRKSAITAKARRIFVWICLECCKIFSIGEMECDAFVRG